MSVSISSRTRLDRARQQYSCCALCEHRCGVNRRQGERGVCAWSGGRGSSGIARCGEELELVPSHLFYLSGCDLRCAFCIAGENAFNPGRGVLLTTELLRNAIPWGESRGARNVQWVGGEPTIHLPAILEVLADFNDFPPIVWKSDFYSTPAAFDLLEGVVDVFVADFKFGNDVCARRIAGIENYCAVITRNLVSVAETNDLIIRHLLLPGHFECCFRPVAERLRSTARRHPASARISPHWRGSFPELANRRVPRKRQSIHACEGNGIECHPMTPWPGCQKKLRCPMKTA
jgi:putative pyruvate formate lyase activating enzyme